MSAPADVFIKQICHFNNEFHVIFSSPEPPPLGTRSVTLLVDISDSMNAHWKSMLMIIGCLLMHSNIQVDKVELTFPKPSGGTAMIDAVKKVMAMPAHTGCELWLLTDGEENRFSGKFFQGTMYSGEQSPEYLAMDVPELKFGTYSATDREREEQNIALVKFMQATGTTMVVLGLGDKVENMLNSLTGIPGVFVGHLKSGQDIDSTLDVVRTLKTSSGRRKVQTLLIKVDEDRKRKVPVKVATQQTQLLKKIIGNIKIQGVVDEDEVLSPAVIIRDEHTLAKTLNDACEAHFQLNGKKELRKHVVAIKANLLLFFSIACATAAPSVIIAGKKTNSIITTPQDDDVDDKNYKSSLNMICSALADKQSEMSILKKTEATKLPGSFSHNQRKCTYTKGCGQYKCTYSLATLQAFRNSATFDSLPAEVLPTVP